MQLPAENAPSGEARLRAQKLEHLQHELRSRHQAFDVALEESAWIRAAAQALAMQSALRNLRATLTDAVHQARRS